MQISDKAFRLLPKSIQTALLTEDLRHVAGSSFFPRVIRTFEDEQEEKPMLYGNDAK